MNVKRRWLGHPGLFLMLVVSAGGCDKLQKFRGEKFDLVSVNGRPAPWQDNEPCTSGDGRPGTGGLRGTKGRLLLSDDSTFKIQSDLGWTCGGPGWGEGSGQFTGEEFGGLSWAGSYSRTSDVLSFVDTWSGHVEFPGKQSGSVVTISGIMVNNRPVEMTFLHRD